MSMLLNFIFKDGTTDTIEFADFHSANDALIRCADNPGKLVSFRCGANGDQAAAIHTETIARVVPIAAPMTKFEPVKMKWSDNQLGATTLVVQDSKLVDDEVSSDKAYISSDDPNFDEKMKSELAAQVPDVVAPDVPTSTTKVATPRSGKK